MTRVLRAMTRFGLGPSGPDRAAATNDPVGWVFGQIGRHAPNRAPILPARQAMVVAENAARARRLASLAAAREAPSGMADAMNGAAMNGEAMNGMSAMSDGGMTGNIPGDVPKQAPKERPANPQREAAMLGRRNALRAAAATPAPFAERWTAHWANHLTVRARGAVGVLLVAPYRAEAIEPHVWGRFADLLAATTLHPAMLNDLENRFSVGPNSIVGQRQKTGANENLARELLELHTLGADGGYTQGDVSALALTLTGWRLPPALNREGGEWDRGGRVGFLPNAHEPGPRTLLGRSFAEDDGTGSQTRAVLAHLASHPSTARNVGRRLAAHFHSPGPGRAALAASLADTFRETEGDLAALAGTLLLHDAPWTDRPVVSTPQGQVVTWMRLLPGVAPPQWAERATRVLGQLIQTAPSPEGWPEAEEWASPGGLKSRLDLANELGLRGGNRHDPIALAADALGEGISDETMTAIRRAASPAQGLSILAMAPEVMLR